MLSLEKRVKKMSKPNTVGLGEYKDDDLVSELESRGYIIFKTEDLCK